ncbi:MAG: hypothetical protein ACLUOF_03295 [Ruminococcus sp.]
MWKSGTGHRRLFRPEYTLTMQAEMLTYTKGDANADGRSTLRTFSR